MHPVSQATNKSHKNPPRTLTIKPEKVSAQGAQSVAPKPFKLLSVKPNVSYGLSSDIVVASDNFLFLM